MPRLLEFFFDFTSTASYLAWTQLDGLATRTGAQLIWKPIFLGGLFRETGGQSNIMVPAKASYMMRDTERCAAHLGVLYKWPPEFPVNSVPLLRGAIVAGEEKVFDTYVPAVWRAIWVEGRNLNDVAEIHKLLGEIGLDAAAFMEKCQAETVKATLKQYVTEAVGRGVFGAPTFFVNGDEMFWGHDRMDYVERALEALPAS